MILEQSTQLAKQSLLFILFVAAGISLLCADDLVKQQNVNEEASPSPFSILKDMHNLNNEDDLVIIKQAINPHEMAVFSNATVRLLQYSTGISANYTIKKGEDHKCNDNISITLRECKREQDNVLHPVNMALISISNNQNIVFEGWIFARNSSLSSPKIDDYFVYLEECGK
jgi:hypothetical protein